jgi:hypothetical protein
MNRSLHAEVVIECDAEAPGQPNESLTPYVNGDDGVCGD